MKLPLKERDPILAVVGERITYTLDDKISYVLVVRRAFVTRVSLDTVHFVVGTTEKWLHLAHEGTMWIRHHQHSKQRKDALLAAGTLLGDEAWATRPIPFIPFDGQVKPPKDPQP